METEYEAKFIDINIPEIRQKIASLGGKNLKKEFTQKRINFYLPERQKNFWIRVRDEGDKITLSLKRMIDQTIEGQKELSVTVDDFDKTILFFESIGCEKKIPEVTKRELWTLENSEITIDTWPFLEPFIEIEGKSEKEVMYVAGLLGLDFQKAIFGSPNEIYKMKYGKTISDIRSKIVKLDFDMENPFL